jgi:hypothetical protein
VLLLAIAPVATAQGRGGRGTQRPAAAAPPPAPSTPPPQVSVVAIRVVGVGLGANGTELRPFNERPGTTVALAVQAPRGSGIVDVDDDNSRVEAFTDDKGLTLLEEARVGPFPKVSADGSAALFEVEVRARPSAGAASVTVQGSVALTLAGGSKPVRVNAVRLEPNQTFKVGTTTMTVTTAKVEDDDTRISIGLPRSVLLTVRDIRFFDAKNAPIEGHRNGSGYMNEKAEVDLTAKTKDKTITIEFELWQNLRTLKVPFTAQAGLGVAPGGKATDAASGEAPSKAEKKIEKPEGPPPAIRPGEGAESVEAVVKQMQTAALAGKGAQVLSVIYPTDRGEYGQGVAVALAFMPMASMSDEKASAAVQKDLDAFFAKHQLKPPFARDPDDLFKGVDLTAFVSDAMLFIKSHAKKGDNPAEMMPVPPGRPENVKITGDTAVATLGTKDVSFARISGRWFIRLK